MSISIELKQSIIEKINRLLDTPGKGHRLIFESDRGYMVLAIDYQSPKIQQYAAAGRALAKRLSPEHAQRLYELGYRRKTAADVFHKIYQMKSTQVDMHLLDEMLPVLNEIYTIDPTQIKIKSRRTNWIELDDDHLIQSMRHASKSKDHKSRQKLYWAFVRADFVLMLHNKIDRDLMSRLPQMSIDEQIQALSGTLQYYYAPEIKHYRAAIIFSRIEYLEHYDVRLWPHIKISGRVLASVLTKDRIDSVLINPRHNIGGELYKNELQSIHEAMQTWGR